MKRYFFIFILACMMPQLFGKVGNQELHERIYAQTDKLLYLAGEQIQMKLITVDTEQIPFVFSKVAYVELVSDSTSYLQIKVALNDGTGYGRMILPVDLPTGYYRLIAYTQFMRNEGAEIFFEKSIGVINTFTSDYNPQLSTVETGRTPSLQLSTLNSQLSTLNSNVVSIKADKTVYSTREHGELQVSGLPNNIYTLSVSIAGKEMIAPNEVVSSPFSQNRSVNPTTDEYLPEYEGHIIIGRIIDNQPDNLEYKYDEVIPAISFPGENIIFFTGQKNETGEVRFITSGSNDIKEIATIVYNTGEKYRIDLQSPFVTKFAPKQMPVLYIDSTYYEPLLERSVGLQAIHYFADDPPAKNKMLEHYLIMKPTNSYPLDEYTRFTTMREVFIEFIAKARFRRRDGVQELSVLVGSGSNYYYGSNPLVFLDGAPISNHDIIYNYDPLDVEYINIYNIQRTIGESLFEGIVELKTYRGVMQGVVFDKSTQIIPFEGPQTREEYLTPDYSSVDNRKSRIPDGRHTLLWNPDVQTEGQSTIRIPFDTSDLSGEFQATIEGITKDGERIVTTAVFKVE